MISTFCWLIGCPLMVDGAPFGVISWTAFNPPWIIPAVSPTTAFAPSAETSIAWPVTATVVPKIFSVIGATISAIVWVPFAK